MRPDPVPPTPSPRDRLLLEGPHPRFREIRLLGGAVADFLRGFRALHFVGPCVTVFGSARFGEDHPLYSLGREVGRRLTGLGFTVMTGGGPGLMEAANRGAREARGRSVGCNIELPHEQQPNRFLDRSVTCRHFFVRKVLLFKYSYAFVALPGGIGTMDELFEALTLIQTGKVADFPVVLMGTDYWRSLIELLDHMADSGAIRRSDLDLLLVTDDLDAAMRHLEVHAVLRFRLRRRRGPTARPWLGESSLGSRAGRSAP
jgi:uncharacterized protein (TIGR00730 family)